MMTRRAILIEYETWSKHMSFTSRLFFILTSMATTLGFAADNGYRLPPQEVVDIIAAPPEPMVSISPDGEWLLLIDREAMPSIADMARRQLRLAGIRIDPAANGLFRTDYG
jgi:hypothetical protein